LPLSSLPPSLAVSSEVQSVQLAFGTAIDREIEERKKRAQVEGKMERKQKWEKAYLVVFVTKAIRLVLCKKLSAAI